MKNLAIITTIILAVTANFGLAQTQILGTFTTNVEGGVRGTVETITPVLEFYLPKSLRNAATSQVNTRLLEDIKIEAGKDMVVTVSNNGDDAEFENFVNVLTTSSVHLLNVGQEVNGIKSKNASSLVGWFGDDTNFTERNITNIVISIKSISFVSTNEGWTDFKYEMSVTLYGSDENLDILSNK